MSSNQINWWIIIAYIILYTPVYITHKSNLDAVNSVSLPSLTDSSMEEVECTVELTTQAVMAACSADYAQVKQAEALIHKLEVKPGFHPVLAVSATCSDL